AAFLALETLRGEAGEAIVADGDPPRRGEAEIASVGKDGVEHAALVPAGAVVLGAAVEEVGLAHEMRRSVAEILGDAFAGKGQVLPDLVAAPDDGDFLGPFVRDGLHVADAVDDVRL